MVPYSAVLGNVWGAPWPLPELSTGSTCKNALLHPLLSLGPMEAKEKATLPPG